MPRASETGQKSDETDAKILKQLALYEQVSVRLKGKSRTEIIAVYQEVNKDMRSEHIEKSRQMRFDEPATERQIALLQKYKVEIPEGLTKSGACELIRDKIAEMEKTDNKATFEDIPKKAKKNDLYWGEENPDAPTPKQLALLKKLGVTAKPKTKREASDLISAKIGGDKQEKA
jgi:hypothetical protein